MQGLPTECSGRSNTTENRGCTRSGMSDGYPGNQKECYTFDPNLCVFHLQRLKNFGLGPLSVSQRRRHKIIILQCLESKVPFSVSGNFPSLKCLKRLYKLLLVCNVILFWGSKKGVGVPASPTIWKRHFRYDIYKIRTTRFPVRDNVDESRRNNHSFVVIYYVLFYSYRYKVILT